MHILLIEHNPTIASVIGNYVAQCGHSVDFASDSSIGMRLAIAYRFDVIMVATQMPEMNGFSVCRALREAPGRRTPILMLGGSRDAIEDRLEAFDSGADGYLVQPWDFQEISARIKALHHAQCSRRDAVLHVGDLSYDLGTLIVRRQGRSLHLQRAQLKILRELMTAAPKPVRYSALENCLWGDESTEAHESTLRVHICGLRAVIDKPFDESMIQTHHGIGYSIGSQSNQRIAELLRCAPALMA